MRSSYHLLVFMSVMSLASTQTTVEEPSSLRTTIGIHESTTADTNTYDIRLVNGTSFCSGRLEVLYNGIWGTVCDDGWDYLNAAVACRQLGCGDVVQNLNTGFGQGSGQIWLDDLQCSGTEIALNNCSSSGWGVHDCVHNEVVGLICHESFYKFGSAAGDSINPASDDGSSSAITLLSPFLFFGLTYQQLYVNNNGFLTFNQASSQFVPTNGSQDIIAGLWTNLDNQAGGVISYHQYTSGSVLTRATQDINNVFPNLTFTASWVFVATWDKVAFFNMNTETSFQVVLTSGSGYSFILMNYGDVAETVYPVQAGYGTAYSTDYFVIPRLNSSSFNTSSNVNIPGRWAFRVDTGSNLHKNGIVGLQGKLTSFLDLTDQGNVQIVLQQIQQELVKKGMPSDTKLNIRKVEKMQP